MLMEGLPMVMDILTIGSFVVLLIYKLLLIVSAKCSGGILKGYIALVRLSV
jgi:hypothetical protein